MQPFQERSFGIIPLKKDKDGWKILLVHHVKGSYWGFPKGHPEPGETPEETAARELHEETGLTIARFLSKPALQEEYDFFRESLPIHKKVTYFFAEVTGEIALQQAEMQGCRWVDLEQAESLITFEQSKSLLRRIVANLYTL